MKLKIRSYGDPVLRQKGAPVEKITAEIKQLVADMLDTMREARGVGLAAQQVGHALQLALIDVRGIKDRPSTMEVDGKSVRMDFICAARLGDVIVSVKKRRPAPFLAFSPSPSF